VIQEEGAKKMGNMVKNESIQSNKNLELLAPAKNFMALKASAPYADAVYFGVSRFNMRMNADNFTLEDLPNIAAMCHHPPKNSWRPRKCYLTTNILVYDHEIEDLRNTIQAAKDARIDAVIVHDMAAIELAKQIGIPFHISTQCNVSNRLAAQYYENLGAERIILARECSLDQVKAIAKSISKAKIETFVHGAMCSSISGRCYLSATIACSQEKSANRGLCTQPCRGEWRLIAEDGHEFLYDGERVFNSRDMCMIDYIPDLIEAGIASLKIEGRMRHPHYVETVTQVYREAIEAYLSGTWEQGKKVGRWITRLKQVYNRGFTTGFYFGRATASDSQLSSPANVSHYRYIEMGRIQTVFPKSGAVAFDLKNGTLKIGDEVIVMSIDKQYDTYFRQVVRDIRMNGEPVSITERGTEGKPIPITITLDEVVNGDGVDAIFKFTDETYKSPSKALNSRKNSGLRIKRPEYRLK
jgi:putative protease